MLLNLNAPFFEQEGSFRLKKTHRRSDAFLQKFTQTTLKGGDW